VNLKAKSKSARSKAHLWKTKAGRSQEESSPQYIFFYGSLKRGGKSYGRLRGRVRFMSPGRIRANLYSLCGGEYCGAVPTTTPRRFVKGDIFLRRIVSPGTRRCLGSRTSHQNLGLSLRAPADGRHADSIRNIFLPIVQLQSSKKPWRKQDHSRRG
jgi:hypothetical protein